MRIRQLVLTSSLLFLALPAFGSSAGTNAALQPPQTTPPSTVTTLKIFSRETIVDVVVTDANGLPIRDLKQSDFAISEDGKPQSIHGFSESGDPTPAHRLPKLPAGIRTNYQATPATGPVNIVLIDAMHLNPASAVHALQATSTYIAKMPQGTQVAIFWLSASGLHLLQGFTSDPSLLLAAAHSKRTDIGANFSCHTQDWYTVDALNQIAEYAAGIKGRKNLIWLTAGVPVYLMRDGGYSWGTTSSCREPRSGGILEVASPYPIFGDGNIPLAYSGALTPNPPFNTPPFPDPYSPNPSYTQFLDSPYISTYTPNSGLLRALPGTSGEGTDMTMVHRLMDTYELFTAEQIAVSPMDPSGIRNLGFPQLAAEQVAEQSGGIAAYNTNDLSSSLAQAIDQGSHYYTLSYVPPRRRPDGHFHTLDVQLNLPGAHLVYRKGYNAEDPKPPAQFSGPALIKAALQGKTPSVTQLVFDAAIRPSYSADPHYFDPFAPVPTATPASTRKGKPVVPRTPYDLTLAVPQDQISFADGPNGTHTVNLQFAFDAYDLNGKFLGSHSQTLTRSLTPEEYQRFLESPVLFHEQISFYPGPLFLRVGVLDSVANKVGTLELSLNVPRP